MGTPAEELQELDLAIEALSKACVYVAGHDQAESVRDGRDGPRHSYLQTLLAQAQKKMERRRERLGDGIPVDPCVPPVSDMFNGRDGGPL